MKTKDTLSHGVWVIVEGQGLQVEVEGPKVDGQNLKVGIKVSYRSKGRSILIETKITF